MWKTVSARSVRGEAAAMSARVAGLREVVEEDHPAGEAPAPLLRQGGELRVATVARMERR